MPVYGPPNVYSEAFFSGLVGTGTTFLVEVPAGIRWILREIIWFQPASGMGGSATAALTETTSGCNIGGFNFAGGTNSNLVEELGRFTVLGPGSILEAQSISVADTAIYLSGQALTLP